MKRLLYAALVMLVSCSSPRGDGEKAAKDENKCAEKCIENIQRLESDFVGRFNPGDYTLRSQAVDAYLQELKTIGDDYRHDLDEATVRNQKLKGQYAKNYKNMGEFNESYDAKKDDRLLEKAALLSTSKDVPASVIASINRIIPPKPDVEAMKADLVGHSLIENPMATLCFFPTNWRLNLDDVNGIKDFQIDEVLADEDREYTASVSMVVQKEYISYKASAQVYYVLPDGKDWELDLVKSNGVTVVKTHKYDDCIRLEMDIFFNRMNIINISEVQLIVGGYLLTDSGRSRFSVRLPAGEMKRTHEKSVEIEFVERE